MKTDHRQKLGRVGEGLAAEYLVGHGYSILGRNVRTPYGEIDLVMQAGEVIVFVEVKTRRSLSLGPPEISITTSKLLHMRSAAEYFIQEHPELHNDWRIDVISVMLQAGNSTPLIDHFENALS
jgi:putative endonuclease